MGSHARVVAKDRKVFPVLQNRFDGRQFLRMQTGQNDVRIALPDDMAQLLQVIRARADFEHEDFCATRLQGVNFRPRTGR